MKTTRFAILHEQARDSARLLPSYVLASVNIPNGWQIVSDIGHRFGVTFEGREACSRSYEPTRKYSYRAAFVLFLEHYDACCYEHARRFERSSKEIHLYARAGKALELIKARMPTTQAGETADYLIRFKPGGISEAEINRLKGLI